jgi:hypothetical protein
MMIKVMAVATAIALSGSVALAQTSRDSSKSAAPTGQPTNGTPVTSGEGSSTTGSNMGSNDRPSSGDASNSGAGPAAGVNSAGPATEPGAVQRGANGR